MTFTAAWNWAHLNFLVAAAHATLQQLIAALGNLTHSESSYVNYMRPPATQLLHNPAGFNCRVVFAVKAAYYCQHCDHNTVFPIEKSHNCPPKQNELGLLTLGCRLVSCKIVMGSGLGTAWPTIVGPNTRARLLMSIRVSVLSATLQGFEGL